MVDSGMKAIEDIARSYQSRWIDKIGNPGRGPDKGQISIYTVLESSIRKKVRERKDKKGRRTKLKRKKGEIRLMNHNDKDNLGNFKKDKKNPSCRKDEIPFLFIFLSLAMVAEKDTDSHPDYDKEKKGKMKGSEFLRLACPHLLSLRAIKDWLILHYYSTMSHY